MTKRGSALLCLALAASLAHAGDPELRIRPKPSPKPRAKAVRPRPRPRPREVEPPAPAPRATPTPSPPPAPSPSPVRSAPPPPPRPVERMRGTWTIRQTNWAGSSEGTATVDLIDPSGSFRGMTNWSGTAMTLDGRVSGDDVTMTLGRGGEVPFEYTLRFSGPADAVLEGRATWSDDDGDSYSAEVRMTRAP